MAESHRDHLTVRAISQKISKHASLKDFFQAQSGSVCQSTWGYACSGWICRIVLQRSSGCWCPEAIWVSESRRLRPSRRLSGWAGSGSIASPPSAWFCPQPPPRREVFEEVMAPCYFNVDDLTDLTINNFIPDFHWFCWTLRELKAARDACVRCSDVSSLSLHDVLLELGEANKSVDIRWHSIFHFFKRIQSLSQDSKSKAFGCGEGWWSSATCVLGGILKVIKPFPSPLELPYLHEFTAHVDLNGHKMFSKFLKEQFRTVPRSGEELGAACASKGTLGGYVFW